MSVRLNFWVVQGILLEKRHTSAVSDMEFEEKLGDFEIVHTDPMSDSDFILGKVLYRYTEELDDEETGKPESVSNLFSFDQITKFIDIMKELGISENLPIKTYALTEMS